MALFANDRSHALDLLVTVLAGSFVAYLFWTGNRLARERAARAEAQRLAAEAQLRLLRAQLEPHMLFNTLATLRSLVEVDAPQAQRMIDQLITYLRAALSASREEATTLAREFEQLRAFLDIMALRMGARLQFELDLPDDLQATPIPPMLLQPLVENAIRHGLEPQVGAGTLRVQARRSAASVEITVADSGLGLGQPAGESSGYGLLHVRERLQAIYGARASLALESVAPHGVRATVKIPA
jgi:LytS/YehU family sensor histidine kinase